MRELFLLMIVGLCAWPVKCDDAGTERARKPLVMAVKIGGISGEAYEITYDERELRYYSARRITALMKAKPVIIKPTEAQWQGFYDELEKLQVWKWKRHYANETMLDGTYWDACIIYSTGEGIWRHREAMPIRKDSRHFWRRFGNWSVEGNFVKAISLRLMTVTLV